MNGRFAKNTHFMKASCFNSSYGYLCHPLNRYSRRKMSLTIAHCLSIC